MARAKHKGLKTRKGTVLSDFSLGSMIDVILDGDPFPTYVSSSRVEVIPGERDDTNKMIRATAARGNPARQHRQPRTRKEVKTMPTDTKPSPRELRRQAKALKIRGWEDMSTKQLAKAVEAKGGEVPTQSTKTKSSTKAKSNGKADKPAKSTKTKSKAKDDDAEIAENGNPFKEGTNLWYITEQLIKGGKRSDMVRRLKKQIELRPRTNADDFDLDYEMDRRVLIIGQLLRNKHGFDVEREGRGPDAEIVATPPS